jgi:cobalt/nickel transport system permease protein
MDWLFKEDNYIPLKDKTTHIDKSVLSILSVLSKIRHEDKSGKGGIYMISSPVKFIFTIFFVVLIALSKNFYYVLLIDSYILFTSSMMSLKDIKRIYSLTSIVVLFTFILLLPSILSGNTKNSVLIICKIAGSVTLLNILSYSTRLRNITNSLKILFVPDIFILIIDMTLKYIIILGEFSVNMLYSLKLRSIGKDRQKHTSVSNLIGVLFLKSKDMAEETYHAMECRCFTGKYKSNLRFKFKSVDLVYIFINSILIIMFFILKKGAT